MTELQHIDANCNDCKFMVRDLDKYNRSLEFHKKLDQDHFEMTRKKLIEAADYQKNKKGNLEAYQSIWNEINKMKFQFDKKTVSINYGRCTKFDKDVSFIPCTCQIETQDCFEHRRGRVM